jgi:hypothetical protein
MDESNVTTDAVDDELYRKAAKRCRANANLEIDEAAMVSVGEGGAWVQGWVWVSDREAGVDDVPEAEVRDGMAIV